jgi:aspartyl-tRNA(Asn)/glutamyl-tRNA(Gln) amidotransferase subunit A
MANRTPTRREFLAVGAGALVAARHASADTPSELASLTLKQAADRIRAKKVSPMELTEACFDRIKTWNPKINAFITLMRDQALAQAKQLGEEAAAGRFRSPLHGIPIGLKDNIDTAGTRTTAASQVYEDRVPSEDAEVVRRLKAAGAILIGKLNLHEFAMGGTSAVSYWGPVRNPWDLSRNSGGSSGGSAAAVAMDCCYSALGTDTGGSIRTPSSYCGVVGFKPTHGRVSIRGIVPLVWSLDHCGPIARSVEDTALVLQQIAGYDRLDVDSQDQPVPDYMKAIGAPVSSFRLGLPPQFFDNLEDDVARAVEDAIAQLNKMTKGSHDVSLPSMRGAGAPGETLTYHEELLASGPGGYEPSTRRGVQNGAQTKVTDVIRQHRQLVLLRRTFEDVFQNVDLLVTPTRRRTARTIEAELKRAANEKPTPPDPENTRPFDIFGNPAITVPCGISKEGLPIGLQIAGPRWGEANVLALAYAFQEATDWHKRRPPLREDTPVPKLSDEATQQTGGR